MTTTVLLTLIPVFVVGAIATWLCRPVPRRQTLVFLWCYRLAMSPLNLRVAADYLTYQRRLRALLGAGALLLPQLVSWAVTGHDPAEGPFTPGWTWLLWGVVAATVWGELSFGRPTPAPGATRAALLASRRLGDYLPRRWVWAPVAAGLAAAAAWASVGLIPGTWLDVEPGALDVAFGLGLGLLVPPVVLGTGAYIVARPQPVVSVDLVATDDALRAAAVRALATIGTTIALLDLAGALIWWAYPLDGIGDIALAALIVTTALLAYLSWLARGIWARSRHAPARPAPPGDSAPSKPVPA